MFLVAVVFAFVSPVSVFGRSWHDTNKKVQEYFEVDLGGSSPTATQITNNFIEAGDIIIDTSTGDRYTVMDPDGPILNKISGTGIVTIPSNIIVTGNATIEGDFTATNGNNNIYATNLVITTAATFSGATIADLGTVTTANIDGGTIDDIAIGGNTDISATQIVSTTVMELQSQSVVVGPDTSLFMIQGWTNVIASGVHTQVFGTAFSATPVAIVVQYVEDPGSATNRIYAAKASWSASECVVTADADKEYTAIAIGLE